jgi:hypothetical protein
MNVQVALGPGITVTPAGGAGYKTWEVIKGHQAGSQSPPQYLCHAVIVYD